MIQDRDFGPQYREVASLFKERITEFCETDPRSEQMKRLVQYLDAKTDFFSCPASCKHHNSFPGGLLMHSMGMCEVALQLREVLAQGIPRASVILVGIFHDLGKIGNPYTNAQHNPRYIPRTIKTGEKAGQLTYNYNKELTSYPIATNSIYILGKFIDLWPDEYQAVLCHDGQYIPENRFVQHQEEPLTLIAHYADYWAGHVLEGEIPWDRARRGMLTFRGE